MAEDALALDPNEPWALMTLGLTLSGSGQHDRALGQLRAALNCQPNWALDVPCMGLPSFEPDSSMKRLLRQVRLFA